MLRSLALEKVIARTIEVKPAILLSLGTGK
jgi:hypothetical protein